MTLQMTIVAPFRNTGKNRLKKNEIVYYFSIDRRWMNRDQAEKVISMSESEGLVKKDGDYYSLSEDLSNIEIPLGYKPSSDIFEKRDYVQVIAGEIAKKAGIELNAVIAEMNALIKDEFDGNLVPEAAIVVMARKYDVPFEDYLVKLKKSIVG